MFDELDAAGLQPNRNGSLITGAWAADGTPVRLHVRRQELYATSLDGLHTYQHAALAKAIIAIKAPERSFRLQIQGVFEQSLTFWRGAPDFVPYYDIRAEGDDGFKESICKNSIAAEDARWTGIEHMAIVFQWDHYDAKQKLVSELPADTTLFNLACAGTAPAKLHLQRHTRAAAYHPDNTFAPEYDTSPDARQTMLKMFTADYCGNGHTFTVDGTPLRYGDAPGTIPFALGTMPVEALWMPTGATCLDNPRLAWGLSTIYDTCGFVLPGCGDTSTWWKRAYLVTALPGAPGSAPVWP